MRKAIVSFLQFCLIGSMIIILGFIIFDIQIPQRSLFLFLFSICSLGFLWFLSQFLLDLRQYSRDGWNFEKRKPRVIFQREEFGDGTDMSPQEMIRFGYPLAILILLGFSVVFGTVFLTIN
jgi:hypothetical protein